MGPILWAVCGSLLWAGNSPEPHPAPPSPILFHCDFESDEWFKAWGETQIAPRTASVSADPERNFVPYRGKALRIRVDQGGHYGASLVYRFQKQIGSEPEEIYFRYYLRFADDWNPERGGKLPGIAGTYGRAGWGGRRVDGQDGWSARGLFNGQKSGRTPIGYYCYHAEMKGRYGENWVWDKDELGFLENNRWYCIEQFARLNTPGKSDGILRGWVDGKLAFEKTDIRMRDVDHLKIETVWLNIYHGGTWTAQSNHHLYIDDVVISRAPVGTLPVLNDEEFSRLFGQFKGCFVLYDAQNASFRRYNEAASHERVSPCSTFKIANSLIALDTGVASGPDFFLPWDGLQRPIAPWNQDQTLASAFASSVVWFYQEIARRIGPQRMAEYVRRLDYGNQDTSGSITNFWLSSSLRISADEQVAFLRRLWTDELPVSAKARETTRQLMEISRGPDERILFGKTGTGGDLQAGRADLGWFVGCVQKDGALYFFATRVEGKPDATGREARKITENILQRLGIGTSPQ